MADPTIQPVVTGGRLRGGISALRGDPRLAERVADCTTKVACEDFYKRKACEGEMMHGGYGHHEGGWGAGMWGCGFLGFIILVIIIWLLIWAFNPRFARKRSGRSDRSGREECLDECDGGRALLCAIVAAIVILFIIWIIWAAVGRCGRRC